MSGPPPPPRRKKPAGHQYYRPPPNAAGSSIPLAVGSSYPRNVAKSQMTQIQPHPPPEGPYISTSPSGNSLGSASKTNSLQDLLAVTSPKKQIKREPSQEELDREAIINDPLNDQQPDSIIGEGVHVRGLLEFDRLLRIDGHFNGKLLSNGDVIVGPLGHLEGDVMNINSLLINGGKVTGNLVVDRLVMRRGSIVTGNITAKSMACDQFVSIIGRANVHPLAPEFIDSDNNIIIEPPEMFIGVLPPAAAHSDESTKKKKKRKDKKKHDSAGGEDHGEAAVAPPSHDSKPEADAATTEEPTTAANANANADTPEVTGNASKAAPPPPAAGDEFHHDDVDHEHEHDNDHDEDHDHDHDHDHDEDDGEGDQGSVSGSSPGHKKKGGGKKKGKKGKKNDIHITPEELREKLTRHYNKHNPEKLANIDEIMEKYKGNEGKLLASLEKKYGSIEEGESTGDGGAAQGGGGGGGTE